MIIELSMFQQIKVQEFFRAGVRCNLCPTYLEPNTARALLGQPYTGSNCLDKVGKMSIIAICPACYARVSAAIMANKPTEVLEIDQEDPAHRHDAN